MKLSLVFLFPSLLLEATATSLLRGDVASAPTTNNAAVSASASAAAAADGSRDLQADEECMLVVRAGSIFDSPTSSLKHVDEEFFCESSDGTLAAIQGTETQTKELTRKLEDGTLVSSESALDMPGLSKGQGADGRPIVTLPGNQKVQVKKGNNGRGNGNRRLIGVVGVKTTLVLRVTDGSGRVHSDSAAVMSDNVFGTYGDPTNMVSQFAACSYDAMTITNDYVAQGVMTQAQFNNAPWSAPGVLDVTTSASLENVGSVETEAVTRAATALGMTLPGGFDFIMISVQNCYDGCGYAAYAYLNHWRSLYLREYYGYPAVILHEIGHNMNLAHSGETVTYDDHSCLMGNPLWGDELGHMCFNPAKNWQLTHSSITPGQWYPSHTLAVDLLNEPSNAATITLVGVAERDVNGNTHPITVKLETGTATDYFMAFNRAIGMNDQNVEADNQVTLVRAGADGENYSTSTLVGKLGQGASTTITNFVSGRDLTLTVQSINTGSLPGVAVVQASLAAERVCMTGVSVNVEVAIVTDNYPTETAWTVKDSSGTTRMSSGGYTTAGVTYTSSSTFVQNSCLTFRIDDSYGDGICCFYGYGSYTLRMNGNTVRTGGSFGSSETVVFGVEAPAGPPTTSSPTPSPSKRPTNSPTNPLPTTSPTTRSPTGSPTTAQPTSSPTPQPTDPPVAFDCSTINDPRRESHCTDYGCTYVRISRSNRCCVNDGQPLTC